jgi:tetratricopeptide (TPR) repeat protein
VAQRSASRWVMVETDNIQLRTSIRRDRAVQLAREMQRTYDVLARYALPCAAGRDTDRVPVTVLPGRQFTELLPAAAGFYRRRPVTWLADYDGQIVIPDDLGFLSRQSFQHEVTHRLVAACFVSPPNWLNEGLASFFETMFYTGDRVTFGRPPYVITGERRVDRPTSVLVDYQRVRVIPKAIMPSLEELFALRTFVARHDWMQTTAAYAAAWALVHFLVLGAPDLTPRYEAFLAELRTPGHDPRAVFARAFEGVPLQDRLNAYLQRGQFDVLESRPSAVIPRSGRINPRIRDMQEEEAHLHLAWMHAGMTGEDGLSRFREHVAAAKRHPRTRRAAYLVAAMALLGTRDLAGAEREVQAALRDAPDDAALLEAHVDILLAGTPSAAELDAAAERLQRVARTPGQLCSLAQVALRRGDRRTAAELSARALELDPRLLMCRIAESADAPPQ